MKVLFYAGFFGWLLFIVAVIFLNRYRIDERGRRPHYFSSNWSRGVFGFGCLGMMEPNFDLLFLQTWLDAFPSLAYIASSFYLFFDPGLNLSRHKEIDYRGEKSGWLDPRLSRIAWWILKGLSLVVLIWSVITIWK